VPLDDVMKYAPTESTEKFRGAIVFHLPFVIDQETGKSMTNKNEE
jgi:hypothetical protein